MTGINILSKTSGGVVILKAGEAHRSGKCGKCHVPFTSIENPDYVEPRTILKSDYDIDLEKYRLVDTRTSIQRIQYLRQPCAICGGSVGELIEVQKKRSRWFNYFFGEWDRKRALYCMKHRDDVLPTGFREGNLTLINYLFSFKLKSKWDEL